jgi:hypothetical protein
MLLGKIFPLAREGARLITSKRSDDMPLKLVPSGTAAVADFLDPRKRRFYIDKSSFIPILEDTADVVALESAAFILTSHRLFLSLRILQTW